MVRYAEVGSEKGVVRNTAVDVQWGGLVRGGRRFMPRRHIANTTLQVRPPRLLAYPSSALPMRHLAYPASTLTGWSGTQKWALPGWSGTRR